MAATLRSDIDHDTWYLDDAKIRGLVRTLSDHVVEVGEGNEVGYGIIEYGVDKGYALRAGAAAPADMKHTDR